MENSDYTMDSILPSEVARLVYGYLLSQDGCQAAAKHFLEASNHMKECRTRYVDGRRFNTRVHGRNLEQILDIFTNIYNIALDNIGQAAEEQSEQTLVQEIYQLLDLRKSFSNTTSNYKLPQAKSIEKSISGDTEKPRAKNTTITSTESSCRPVCEGSRSSSSLGKPKKDDVVSDETVEYVLSNLLDNTELHEKLAEKINKVIATPEKESSVTSPDVIQTIVKETEEDPWIQSLITEICATNVDEEENDVINNNEIEDINEGLEVQRKNSDERDEENQTVSNKQRFHHSQRGAPNSELSDDQDDNAEEEANRDISENEETKSERRTSILDTALSNCNIGQTPESSPKVTSPTKDNNSAVSSNIDFCFVDVNETSQPGAPQQGNNTGMETIPVASNTSMITLPSPLFGSGSIFTIVPPMATSTPYVNPKNISAVIVNEDPLKVPSDNIYTENNVSMVIPLATTPTSWGYVPIRPKPDNMDKPMKSMGRGQNWRRGLRGSIKKTIPQRSSRVRKILPKRPPVRNLSNVPEQTLYNGVKIEVLDNASKEFRTENHLETILEEVHECSTINEEAIDEQNNYENNDISASCLSLVTDNQITHTVLSSTQVDISLKLTDIENNKKSLDTPGPLPRKKISLSTPRRKSHVRALDFNTPPKKIVHKKSHTSPKRIPSALKSGLNAVKRGTLFKSPPFSDRNKRFEKEKNSNLIFKSPNNKDMVPVATLSPAATPLKGDWDKVNGVEVVMPNSKNKCSSSNKDNRNQWDKELRLLIGDVRSLADSKEFSPPKKTRTRGTKRKTPKKKISDKNIVNNKNSNKKTSKTKKVCGAGKRTQQKDLNVKIEEGKSDEINSVDNHSNSVGGSTLRIKDIASLLPNNDNGSDKSENIKSDTEGLLMVVEEAEESEEDEREHKNSKVVGKEQKENRNTVDSDTIVLAAKASLQCNTDGNSTKNIGNSVESIDSVDNSIKTNVNNSLASCEPVQSSLNIVTDFAIPTVLLHSDHLNKDSALPILETPVKLDFEGLVPKTPCVDTPMLKTIRDNTSILSRDLLLTPSLPATPYQEGVSNSFSNLSNKTPPIKEVFDNNQDHQKTDIYSSKNEDKGETSGNNKNVKKETSVLNKKKNNFNKKSPSKKKSYSTKSPKKMKSKSTSVKYKSVDSAEKHKKKIKTPDQIIQKYLKKAKEELFGNDSTSDDDDDDMFEKKGFNKLNVNKTRYSSVYSDSSLESPKSSSKYKSPSSKQNLKYSPVSSNTVKSPTKSQDSKTTLVNRDKMKSLKNNSQSEISFNACINMPKSIEELVENTKSPQKLRVNPAEDMSKKLDTSTPPKSNLNVKDNINNKLLTPVKTSIFSPAKSPCPQKNDELSKQKNVDNECPSLHLSSDGGTDELSDKTAVSTENNIKSKFEENNLPTVTQSDESDCIKGKLNKNQDCSQEKSTMNEKIVFVSKNESSMIIVFDEKSFTEKPSIQREKIDDFKVDVLVDTDEVGKEIYCTLSVTPLHILLDLPMINKNTSTKQNKNIKCPQSSSHSDQETQRAVNASSCSKHRDSSHHRTSRANSRENFEKSDRRDQDHVTCRNSRSNIRERSPTRRHDPSVRTMEYTQRSDGKRRIKPIRLDDDEYESRLKHRDTYRSHRRTRSPPKYIQDKSRSKRKYESSRRSSSQGHKSDYERKSDKKASEKLDQDIEDEDRKINCTKKLVSAEERKLMSYDSVNEEINSMGDTEDDLMNFAVIPGSSSSMLSKKVHKEKQNTETDNSSIKPSGRKRKESSNEESVISNKRLKTDDPQALLKKVDLDLFLSVVHGENSTTSCPPV